MRGGGVKKAHLPTLLINAGCTRKRSVRNRTACFTTTWSSSSSAEPVGLRSLPTPSTSPPPPPFHCRLLHADRCCLLFQPRLHAPQQPPPHHTSTTAVSIFFSATPRSPAASCSCSSHILEVQVSRALTLALTLALELPGQLKVRPGRRSRLRYARRRGWLAGAHQVDLELVLGRGASDKLNVPER
jgi:hypothetical protein